MNADVYNRNIIMPEPQPVLALGGVDLLGDYQMIRCDVKGYVKISRRDKVEIVLWVVAISLLLQLSLLKLSVIF